MRAPSETCTSWKLTLLDSVAEYSFTGTCASPKLIVPFQIDLGMGLRYPPVRAATQP
jgi:hypothetical protein